MGVLYRRHPYHFWIGFFGVPFSPMPNGTDINEANAGMAIIFCGKRLDQLFLFL